MSGPKAGQYDIVDAIGTVFAIGADLAASVTDAAERERQRLETQRRENERLDRERRELERQRRAQERDRLLTAQVQAEALERRAGRLASLARSAGVAVGTETPQVPSNATAEQLEFRNGALEAVLVRMQSSLQSALSAQAADVAAKSLAGMAKPQSAAELLDAYAAQVRLRPSASGGRVDNPEQRKNRAQKVLGRLADGLADAIPRDMEALVAEMIASPSAERAEALELELRLRVQRHNEEVARRAAERAEAEKMLAGLPDSPLTEGVRQELELVAAGMAGLTESLRARIRESIAAHESKVAEDRQRSASRMLEQTLKDLGYATEPIQSTLFVQGGVAHMHKEEWGDYYVRLRVDPRESTVNFNMVRERDPADTSDRRQADQAAEESWCSGLPKLMKTLEARGLHIELKRRLNAGALPVQTVEPGTVPEVLKPAARRASGAPRARAARPD